MEVWQKEHIRKNKTKLLDYTRCNPQLLHQLETAGIFGVADIEEIKSKKSNRLNQASRFYEIITTRPNGYPELLKALSESKQGGALKLLLKGIPEDHIAQLQVSFLGRDYYLQELLDLPDDISELADILRNSLNKETYIKMILEREQNSEVIQLLKNTIPPPEAIYLPRHLTRRTKVNAKIFTADCPDVFAISQVSRAQLSQLAAGAKRHTATSTQQVVKLTSRFILLEDPSHWKDICDIAGDTPVHFITYDKDSEAYLLTKTTGGSKIINQFLGHQLEAGDSIIPENDLMAKTRETGFCICDLPGMGKSLLLAKLAREFAKSNPNLITAFIPLSSVAQSQKSNSVTRMEDFWSAMTILVEYLATSEFSKLILIQLIKKQLTKLYIYFDGIDEVSLDKLPSIKMFLRTLQKGKELVQIHVTSRTHMRHELEASLGVIPYDMLPFNHDNKTQFLINFWMQQDPTCDEAKLAEFANYCLLKWKDYMKEGELEITGIPLQCRLLAEVYCRHAHKYSKQAVPIFDVEITETSLTQLYISYLKIGRSRVQQNVSSTLNESEEDIFTAVERFHIWKALQLLYPKIADLYAQFYNIQAEAIDMNKVMCMGFLLNAPAQGHLPVKFVHQTFAEFLAARFFVSILTNAHLTTHNNEREQQFEQTILQFFLQKVAALGRRKTTTIQLTEHTKIKLNVHHFSAYMVMKFVNDQIQEYSSFNQHIYSTFAKVVSAEQCYNFLISTLVNNLPYILRLIKQALSGLSLHQLWWHQRYISCYSTGSWNVSRSLCLAYTLAKFSNAATGRELYETLSQVYQFDLKDLHNNSRLGIKKTPIHVAVERADYEVVEHVLQYNTSCNEKELLEYMVKKSYEDPINIIQNKIDVCELLRSKNPSTIREIDSTDLILCWSPYSVYSRGRVLNHSKQSNGIHPELFKILARHGACMTGKNKYDKNIVELAALYWTAEELFGLVDFIINDMQNTKLLENFHVSLFQILKNSREAVSSQTMNLIADHANIQWEAVDEFGNTLIHAAIAGNQSFDVITECIEKGADFNAKNKTGWNALHVAAAQRNVEMVNYLVDIGVSITEKTKAGNTSLHLFFLKTKTALKLLKSIDLWASLPNERKRFKVDAALTHTLVTTYITNQFDTEIKLMSAKNNKWRNVLHNYLYDEGKDLEMDNDTLVLMLNGLEINVYETDKTGNNLLSAAIKGKKDKSILELLMKN